MVRETAAVVTGGASGIGAATVSRLLEAGHAVYAVDCAWPSRDSTRDGFVAVEADVTDTQAIEQLRAEIEESGKQLKVLVNAAGVPGRSPLVEFDDEEFARMVNVNLYGVAMPMRSLLPILIREGGGAVVNVASMAARRTDKTLALYSATKAGVVSLSRVAALEHARHGVRVNCVLPGPIDTPMLRRSAQRLVGHRYGSVDEVLQGYARAVPVQRLGSPDEVAAVITFLASDAASYVTGEEIGVGGGIHLS